MSEKLVVAGVALGLFALLVAFTFPAAIQATATNQTTAVTVEEGDTETVTEGLEVTADDTSNMEATVTFLDLETNDRENVTIAQGATENVTVAGEFLNVTAVETTNAFVELEVTHDRMYGWSDGAKALMSHMDVLLVLLSFLMLFGALAAVMAS